MKILLAIFSLLVFVGTASADSVWTYTGNTMTGCNCALDGTVTLDSSGDATRGTSPTALTNLLNSPLLDSSTTAHRPGLIHFKPGRF